MISYIRIIWSPESILNNQTEKELYEKVVEDPEITDEEIERSLHEQLLLKGRKITISQKPLTFMEKVHLTLSLLYPGNGERMRQAYDKIQNSFSSTLNKLQRKAKKIKSYASVGKKMSRLEEKKAKLKRKLTVSEDALKMDKDKLSAIKDKIEQISIDASTESHHFDFSELNEQHLNDSTFSGSVNMLFEQEVKQEGKIRVTELAVGEIKNELNRVSQDIENIVANAVEVYGLTVEPKKVDESDEAESVNEGEDIIYHLLAERGNLELDIMMAHNKIVDDSQQLNCMGSLIENFSLLKDQLEEATKNLNGVADVIQEFETIKLALQSHEYEERPLFSPLFEKVYDMIQREEVPYIENLTTNDIISADFMDKLNNYKENLEEKIINLNELIGSIGYTESTINELQVEKLKLNFEIQVLQESIVDLKAQLDQINAQIDQIVQFENLDPEIALISDDSASSVDGIEDESTNEYTNLDDDALDDETVKTEAHAAEEAKKVSDLEDSKKLEMLLCLEKFISKDMKMLWKSLFENIEKRADLDSVVANWHLTSNGRFELTLKGPYKIAAHPKNEKGEEEPKGGVVYIFHDTIIGSINSADKKIVFDKGVDVYFDSRISSESISERRVTQPIREMRYYSQDRIGFKPGLGAFSREQVASAQKMIEQWGKGSIIS